MFTNYLYQQMLIFFWYRVSIILSNYELLYRLRVFENTVLRRIFGPKRD